MHKRAAGSNRHARNYGIDAARLVSMLMVVILHNLGHGGVLDWTLDSRNDIVYAAIENYSIIAVNIFALISGYLSCGKQPNYKRSPSLWGDAIFWSGAMALVGYIRGDIGGVLLSS